MVPDDPSEPPVVAPPPRPPSALEAWRAFESQRGACYVRRGNGSHGSLVAADGSRAARIAAAWGRGRPWRERHVFVADRLAYEIHGQGRYLLTTLVTGATSGEPILTITGHHRDKRAGTRFKFADGRLLTFPCGQGHRTEDRRIAEPGSVRELALVRSDVRRGRVGHHDP